MTTPRSSTARSKAARSPESTPSPARKTASRTGPASSNGRSQAAEILREIQIDGKALSLQIERLRHRFL